MSRGLAILLAAITVSIAVTALSRGHLVLLAFLAGAPLLLGRMH